MRAPTIIPLGELMVMALLPIIRVEAWVLWVRLDVGFDQALKISGNANLVSMILGVPAVWFLGGIVQEDAKGLVPRSNAAWKHIFNWVLGSLGTMAERNSSWVTPSVLLVLLVPFFFLSWLIEWVVIGRVLGEAGSTAVLGSALLANLASQPLLILMPLFELSQARESLSEILREVRSIRLVDAGLARDGRVFTADQHGTIRFFDADTGRQVHAQGPLQAEIDCETVGSDGRFAVGFDRLDGDHVVWEHATGREVSRLDYHDRYSEAGPVFSPNGDLLAGVSEYDGVLRVWSCDTGHLTSCFSGHCGESITFSPASSIVAVQAWKTEENETIHGEVVYLLDQESDNPVHTIDMHGPQFPTEIGTPSSADASIEESLFSCDGQYLAVAQSVGLISIYNSGSWDLAQRLEVEVGDGMIVTMTFSPKGSQLAFLDSDGIVRLMNVATGECDSETKIPPRSGFVLVFTRDGSRLIVVREPESIIRLHLADGRFIDSDRLQSRYSSPG